MLRNKKGFLKVPHLGLFVQHREHLLADQDDPVSFSAQYQIFQNEILPVLLYLWLGEGQKLC